MSGSEMAIIKPEAMKSYIWLECADGSIQQVEEEVAMFCPMICREIVQKGMGSSKNFAISLPERVNPSTLSLILDYCRFHQTPGRSNKERKSFDEKFVKTDTKRLCELASASDSLQLKPLVDLTSRALARMIEGKTPEEIRETFHLPDDLTEEEKLEPLKNTTDDPRIRLLNRLYAKKRKELQERQKLKDTEIEEERVDERSVDDLLSFINGDGDSKGIKTAKQKKKNRRRKDQLKNPCRHEDKMLKKEVANLSVGCHNADSKLSPTHCRTSKRQSAEDEFASKVEFDDADIDDELDPAMKEELDRFTHSSSPAFQVPVCLRIMERVFLDQQFWINGTLPKRVKGELREVEDFARRLNFDWPERMQEILSSGQERRLVPNLMNGNGSVRRYSGVDRR